MERRMQMPWTKEELDRFADEYDALKMRHSGNDNPTMIKRTMGKHNADPRNPKRSLSAISNKYYELLRVRSESERKKVMIPAKIIHNYEKVAKLDEAGIMIEIRNELKVVSSILSDQLRLFQELANRGKEASKRI